MGLKKNDVEKLQYEVVSEGARLKLTRLIRGMVNCSDLSVEILRQNRVVNIARNVLGSPLYVLDADDMGDYHTAEHSWHFGEIELTMRRPNSTKLVEILADLLEDDILDLDMVNEILYEDGSSIQFKSESFDDDISVLITPISEIEELEDSQEHPNIRKLIKRMEDALEGQDFPAVLHASASVFETLAKDIVSLQTVQNKSLGAFFDRFKKDSLLPEPILEYIKDIFNRRNTEALAGHGSLQTPTIERQEAVVLVEMTKTFVRIERQLAIPLELIDTTKKDR